MSMTQGSSPEPSGSSSPAMLQISPVRGYLLSTLRLKQELLSSYTPGTLDQALAFRTCGALSCHPLLLPLKLARYEKVTPQLPQIYDSAASLDLLSALGETVILRSQLDNKQRLSGFENKAKIIVSRFLHQAYRDPVRFRLSHKI